MPNGGRVDRRVRGCNVVRMSVAEIKSAIDRMSRAELDAVSAHLRQRRWLQDGPEQREELATIMGEMDAGKKYSLGELKARLADREAGQR